MAQQVKRIKVIPRKRVNGKIVLLPPVYKLVKVKTAAAKRVATPTASVPIQTAVATAPVKAITPSVTAAVSSNPGIPALAAIDAQAKKITADAQAAALASGAYAPFNNTAYTGPNAVEQPTAMRVLASPTVAAAMDPANHDLFSTTIALPEDRQKLLGVSQKPEDQKVTQLKPLPDQSRTDPSQYTGPDIYKTPLPPNDEGSQAVLAVNPNPIQSAVAGIFSFFSPPAPAPAPAPVIAQPAPTYHDFGLWGAWY